MDKIFGLEAGSRWRAKLRPTGERSWHFDSEPFLIRPKTLDDVRDEMRLRKLLKRAVNNSYAPQSLIDSIRKSIRV
ncbi:MAG: hypothetical protein WBD16_02505 [Pyrinomonadaceae bacterium]